MFTPQSYSGSREDNYKLVIVQLQALIDGELNWIANLSNASALLNVFFQEINWVGFYVVDGDQDNELVLGPFQGLPACVRIPFGRGVCGTAAAEHKTIVVEDVHAFPGHIACDAASRSEIVVPMIVNGEVVGVLDIDSPVQGRFDDTDRVYLEQFVAVLTKQLS